MLKHKSNNLPRDLISKLVDRFGKTIEETPFSHLKNSVLNLYEESFKQSALRVTQYYIEGKVTSQLKFHKNKSVTFYIEDKAGTRFSIYVPSENNILNYIRYGDIVGIKGKLHFYREGVINGYDYIQFNGTEVRCIGRIRKDCAQLLEYVEKNKRRKKFKFLFKKKFRIALVTSQTSEAILDIENNIGYNKFFLIDKYYVNLYDSKEISDKIMEVDRMSYDAILIARGGMNRVDIFNEYNILNAIFTSQTLVITAIGHASVSPLSDIVADYSYDTPSVAALKLNYKKAEYNSKRTKVLTVACIIMLTLLLFYFQVMRHI